jgi:hypothetical protein
MEKLKQVLKSRTFWTIVIMFLLGGLQAITDYLPEGLFIFIQGGLTLLATYFKVNPSQKY